MRDVRVAPSCSSPRTSVWPRGWLALVLLMLGCGRIGLDLRSIDGGDGIIIPGSDASASEDDVVVVDASVDDPEASVPDALTELPSRCTGTGCTTPGCPADDSKTEPGICGCGFSDTTDTDGDGVVDCVDFCPGVADRLATGDCACAAANQDSDGDGTTNCEELCPFDARKMSPGMCGCGALETDTDDDGTPDCIDACPSDANKQSAGSCGCGVTDSDTDLDGTADCIDRCSTANESSYVPDATCGVGYCRANNEPSSCVAGKETACMAAPLLSTTDSSCDGIDDDCDGQVDEDFVSRATSCGLGECASTGTLSCVNGVAVDSCVAGTRTTTNDNTCNDRDDDCDGAKDDDVPTTPTTCSMGVCASTGVRACIGGMLVDSCMQLAPTSSNDATCDNLDQDCDGQIDEDYPPGMTSCGVGFCRSTGTRTCVRGAVVDSCRAGARRSTTDTTCDGIDDDCDGTADEDFVGSATSCGVGACRSTGTLTCVGGATRNSCVARTPTVTTDDAFTPGNGVDDDCDGRVDEDVPACNTTARTFETGSYSVAVPGNCKSVTVRLWGGGGASGQPAGITSVQGGTGGPGGYATATSVVSGALTLYVGGGAASGCNNPGTNPGSSTFNGGSGGTGAGADGNDASANGGGLGGAPSSGNRGGRGRFGGGGGGQGSGGLGTSGNGGGGGAASVFIVNGTRAAIAGGGGGGGGAQATTPLGTIASRGGAGGSGCGAAGQVDTSIGGGGGGGGLCLGSTVQVGSGVNPASSGSIPSGRGRGASGDCAAGGAGYAIITFAP